MNEGFYCRPLAVAAGVAAGLEAQRLAGGALSFAFCEATHRHGGERVSDVSALRALRTWAEERGLRTHFEAWLARLSAPRPDFAGLAMDRPWVMAVINVTPDSFSDGGDRFDPGRAVADGLAMQAAGAAILDVGGESTRPGAEPVTADEELRRVIPVVRTLAEQGALVSIDSRQPAVMAEALAAGARIINDVTALAGDPLSLRLAAEAQVPVVLMHMRGEPRTMQADPVYDDVALDVYDWLEARVQACEAAGLPRALLAVDPGIGFGKTVDHNLRLLDRLALFHGLGCPLVLGVSRKSFIGKISRDEPPKARLPGSLAAALAGIERGAQILRVHDVAETRQAIDVWRAIVTAEPAVLAASA